MPRATRSEETTIISQNARGEITVNKSAQTDVRNAVISFLDMSSTATGRQTFYNSKEDQLAAVAGIHEGVFMANRGLYAAMLTLPGLTDFNVQHGIMRLLQDLNGVETSLLSPESEWAAIDYVSHNLPPQRLFKMFKTLRANKVNNKRVVKLILRSILAHKNLEFWSVKYRNLLKQSLQHAWGVSASTKLRATLQKNRKNIEDKRWINKRILKYTHGSTVSERTIQECVLFILGSEHCWTSAGWNSPLINGFFDARQSLQMGKDLPPEVLEGIRSIYHPHISHAEVLELTKNRGMTEGQKAAKQRSAQKQGVKMEFNPNALDLVKLYIYALEMGGSQEILQAAQDKAKRAAAVMPVTYNKIGIVLDASMSMFGSKDQKRRPMAIGLAMRDVLAASALDDCFVSVAGGKPARHGLVHPEGDTSLSESLLETLKQEPDVVYMITDGYENAPDGRLNEVVTQLRRIGIDTPIYQVTPVMAAEAVKNQGAIRRISKDISPLPVSQPEAIGISFIRAAIDADLENGIKGLLNITLPQLEG